MQWFKHYSNMRHTVKIKRLISRYGIEGYGLYCIIIESITESLCTKKPLPELDETCEDIATFYNGNTAHINEMMSFMLNNDLFELNENNGLVMCNSIYELLDASQTRSEEIRLMIKNYKKEFKKLMSQTVRDIPDFSDRIEKNRIEYKRIEKKENKNNKKKKINTNVFNYDAKIKFLDYVYLTQIQYDSLCHDYGKSMIDKQISSLDNYLTNNPDKQPTGRRGYKDHNKVLRVQWLKDVEPIIKAQEQSTVDPYEEWLKKNKKV